MRAQDPLDIPSEKANVWEHYIGPEAAIHLTAKEVALDDRFSSTYVGFMIVVSPEGRVESAVPTRSAAEAPLKVPPHIEEALAIELARTFKPWFQNGAPVRVRVHDSVDLLPPERWAATHVPFPENVDMSKVTIRLTRKKSMCICPGYTVVIAGDGSVSYHGEKAVIMGNHDSRISPDAVRELVTLFRQANFFSAFDKYEGGWTDSPTQTLTLTIGPMSKTVVDYVGLDDGLPLAIRNLEGQIDEAVNIDQWTKANYVAPVSLGVRN